MYPTTADLVAASTVAALTGLTTEQQDALRDAAIAAVEGHCRQRFVPDGTTGTPVTMRVDGSGGTSLYLPARISELTGLAMTGEGADVSLENVQVSDDRERLTIVGAGSGSTWADRAFAEFKAGRDAVFPVGVDNIEVTGVWGWTDLEYTEQLAAVTTAIRFDMEDKALAGAHALGDTVRASRALGLNSVNQGRLSINLGQEMELSVRVRQKLGPFVFNHAAGAVV